MLKCFFFWGYGQVFFLTIDFWMRLLSFLLGAAIKLNFSWFGAMLLLKVKSNKSYLGNENVEKTVKVYLIL